MGKLRALLFDVDGTLVDTEELHRQAFNQAFVEFALGWSWDRDLYAGLLAISGGSERISRHIDGLDAPAGEKTRLRRLVPAIHREKTRIYGELLAGNGVRLRPGVGPLVDEAMAAGVRIGLASTSALVNVRPLVAAAFGSARSSAVAAVVGVDLVARKKPAPDLYELLLSTLHLPAAACVAFEDSANGLAAARAAGLRTVVTPTRWTLGQAFDGADLLLPSLADVGGARMGLAEVERLLATAPAGAAE